MTDKSTTALQYSHSLSSLYFLFVFFFEGQEEKWEWIEAPDTATVPGDVL